MRRLLSLWSDEEVSPDGTKRAAYAGVRMAFLQPSDQIIDFEKACLQAGDEQLEERLLAFADASYLPTTGDGWMGRALALAALEHPMLNPPKKAGRPRKMLSVEIVERAITLLWDVEHRQRLSEAAGSKLSDREACRKILVERGN